MKDLLQRLSVRGWQLTPQRRRPSPKCWRASTSPLPTADEIHERAVARLS